MISEYKIEGRLDTNNALEVENKLQPYIDNCQYLILDFSNCTYLSSMGIRILIKAKKSMMKKQGEIIITHLSQMLTNILSTAGLTNILTIKNCNEEAYHFIAQLEQKDSDNIDFDYLTIPFHFNKNRHYNNRTALWDSLTLAGYNELGISIGIGEPADDLLFSNKITQHFISTPFASFFYNPLTENIDYRITTEPTQAGIYCESAISFGDTPIGYFKCTHHCNLSLAQIADTYRHFCKLHYQNSIKESICIIFDNNETTPSIHFLVLNYFNKEISGLSIELDEWIKEGTAEDFLNILKTNLTIHNIANISPINLDLSISNPICWPFLVQTLRQASEMRIQIETPDNIPLELYKEFLARRIYSDSKKLIIKKLNGGYSAQTYQVTSYDTEGRKLRSTVMKMADKDIIKRESDRCAQNAIPFIMNNCANVIGTQFFAGKGALRYNFVGIGGEDSKIKWLTEYYLEDSFDFISPILDKIFLLILRPWYGQAIEKKSTLFLDHDPTLTFFPHIFEVAKQEFNINTNDQYIDIEECNGKFINPYWFLKHEYPKNRKFEYDYLACICHGDLNMQNILLDEKMNIYLIDFSETKMRSIISDFARLEAILLVDNAPIQSKEEYELYIRDLIIFYQQMDNLKISIDIDTIFTHNKSPFINKNILITKKLREYALHYTHQNGDPIPYYFALLEWIFPIITYRQKSYYQKRVAMIISALLCNKINHFLLKNNNK